ncbi:MAG: 3-oxoacyl-ACP synthase, partial [Chitinophagaceae bacterium]
MNKITAAITAGGGYVPDYVLTNAELEKLVDTNDEWIRTRTGISERRILKGPGTATSDLAVPAVMELLQKRNLDPNEIECIICATVTPDMIFPSTSSIIAYKVGATKAF